MNLAFPYRFDDRGRTAAADDERHVREMIEMVLFTSPGERVNRPDFGSGLLRLVFGPNSPELASATQLLIQGSLLQWLGDLILVNNVTVASDDASLRITVDYTLRATREQRVATFVKGTA